MNLLITGKLNFATCLSFCGNRSHMYHAALAKTLVTIYCLSSSLQMKAYNPMVSAMSSNSSPDSRHMSPHMSPRMSPSRQHNARRTPKHTMLQKAQSFHLPLGKYLHLKLSFSISRHMSPHKSPCMSPSRQHKARVPKYTMLQKAQSFHLPLGKYLP